MMRRSERRGGYVMLEALAALAISGLVLAAVPLASGILIRTWQRVTQGSDTLDTLATGLAVVRQELSTLRRERFPGRDDVPYMFLGTPDTVGAVLPGGGGPNDTGEAVVVLSVRPEAAGNTLLRGSVPYRPDIRSFVGLPLADPVVLLTGPWRYQFQYADRRRGKIEWIPEWQDEGALPFAIRLDVTDYVTGARIIPPLVVPLRIEADPGCIDNSGGDCGV